MTWIHYLASFFAGLFLANFVPHFVSGICGNRFPTPFAKPPGRGLSSATVNVVWALANLVVGFFLFRAGRIATGHYGLWLAFFFGIATISLLMSANFAHKEPR